jgi:hypothetical protein
MYNSSHSAIAVMWRILLKNNEPSAIMNSMVNENAGMA